MPIKDIERRREENRFAVMRHRGQIPSQKELDIIDRINATHDTIIGLENSIIELEVERRKVRRKHRAKRKAEKEQKKVE